MDQSGCIPRLFMTTAVVIAVALVATYLIMFLAPVRV